jgi:Alg9-like mannosyltransferase family
MAGALIGLACSTKYTVWLLGVPFLAAHIAARGGVKQALKAWPLVLAALGAAVIAFIVATPYSVIDARRFLEDMWFNWLTGAPAGTLSGQRRSWGPYVLTLGNALGWPLLILATAGVVVTLARVRQLDRRGAAALLVHGTWILSFWLFYGISPHHALRFIMPIVPSLLLLAAAGVVHAARTSPGRRREVAIVTAVVLVYSLAYTAAADRKFLRDPRYDAGVWLKDHIGADTTVGFFTNESYLPYFDRPAFRVQSLDVMSQSGIVGDAFAERIRQILSAGPEVIVDADFYYDRFLEAPDRFPDRAAFYQGLLAGSGAGGFRPLARFTIRGPWWLNPSPELVAPEVVVFGRLR